MAALAEWAARHGVAGPLAESDDLSRLVYDSLWSEPGVVGPLLSSGLKEEDVVALSLLPGVLRGFVERGDVVCHSLLAQLPQPHHAALSPEDEVRQSPMNVFPDKLLPPLPHSSPATVYASVPSGRLLRAGLSAYLSRLGRYSAGSRAAFVRCAASAFGSAEMDGTCWRLVALALHRCAALGTEGAVRQLRTLHAREDCAQLRLLTAAVLLKHPGVEPLEQQQQEGGEERGKGKEDA